MKTLKLTKEIEKNLLAAVGHTDHGNFAAIPVVVKLFTPDAQCTWFIVEGSQVGDDWQLFGLCDLGMGSPELGYVSLNELKAARGKFGLPVEKDNWYTGSLADAMKSVGYAFEEVVS